jgi:hypothetical protein
VKKWFGFVLVLVTAGLLVLEHQWNNVANEVLQPPPLQKFDGNPPTISPEKSAIGSKENPQAREAYETAMIVDPQSGEIPFDIRRKELGYVSNIRRNSERRALRKGSSDEDGWRSIGPYNVGGRTRALAIDVSNERIILAGGVSGGMWRSENEGGSWTKTTAAASIHSVSCIAQDKRPGKENIWYYGTGEFTSNSASKKSAPYRGDGVFKSIDGGNSWLQLASTSEGVANNYNSQFQYIWKILPNSKNMSNDEVFLAAVGGVFRSIDGGLSWEVVLGKKSDSTPDTDLNDSFLSDYTDIAQTENGIFYAVFSQRSRNGNSADRGVFRSVDGVNWTRITPGIWPRNYGRTVIATSKSSPNEIYFSTNALSEMLFKFTNFPNDGNGSGGIWEDLSDNLPAFGGDVGDYDSQGSYNMVLKVHPSLKDVIFLGGTNLYRSTDGFSSTNNIAWIGGYDTLNNVKIFQNHFVDQHDVVFFPSNPNKMLSSNDGGIYLTEENNNPSIFWIPLNNGFVTSQFYSLGLDEFGERGDVIGGLQDNGTLVSNKPVAQSTWSSILSGDGGYSAITKNSLFYYSSFQFGKVYRFKLDKNYQTETFTRVDPNESGGEDKLLFVNPFVLAPENQHMMYFAGGDVVWRNSNTSQIPLYKNHGADVNWQKMTDARSDHGLISAINASYNPSGTVYYGSNTGEIYKINNANSLDYSVEEMTSNLFPENSYVSCIAIDRKESNHIAVSFSNYNIISLFYSENGGESFENISGNMEENPDGSGSGPSIRWVEIVSKNDDSRQLFLGTSTGLYSSNSINGNNTEWEQEGAETIGNALVVMVKYFSEDGTIVAATHGNGMYESQLDNVWNTVLDSQSEQFAFGDPFPNPFVETIKIPFTIPRDGLVRARIYNGLGKLITTLLWSEQYAGENMISWNGTNELGVQVATGTYICSLEFEDQKIASRLVYLK